MSGPTVGAQLRAARKFDRLTLREVAEKVGVGVPHLSKVENDQENPSDELLYRLAEVYDLSGDLLVLFAGRVPQRFVAALVADPVRALDLLSTLPCVSSAAEAPPQDLTLDLGLRDCMECDTPLPWGHQCAPEDSTVAGAGGGLNVPSNFTDSPTPTPTAVAESSSDDLRAPWVCPPCRRDEHEQCMDAGADACDCAHTSAEAGGPSPAGTPETEDQP